jgi:hypothetical protein
MFPESPRQGRGAVATGGGRSATGTRGNDPGASDPAPDGAEGITPPSLRRLSVSPSDHPFAPPGQNPACFKRSTGSAQACRPSLHPWLQACVPFGTPTSDSQRTDALTRRTIACRTRRDRPVGENPLAIARVWTAWHRKVAGAAADERETLRFGWPPVFLKGFGAGARIDGNVKQTGRYYRTTRVVILRLREGTLNRDSSRLRTPARQPAFPSGQ